jgi:protoporphyrinogen oxidase
MNGSKHILVLGGGVCGLYAAKTLLAKGFRVTILEKEELAGGLARGNERNGNYYDLGVHMLHEHDQEIFEEMKKIMGDERIEVPLDAKIRWADGFYRYPLQFGDMLHGIPIFTLISSVLGLFWSQLYYKIFPQDPRDAEEALIQLYGNPLYEFFFREFTHRYWGLHPQDISARFVTTKMPRLTAVDVFKKALAMIGIKEREGHRAVESALLEERLHYSRKGSEAMPRLFAKAIREAGGEIVLQAQVSQIHHDGRRVEKVSYRTPDGERKIECDECISTIPLPALIRGLTPDAPPEVVHAAKSLHYKAIAIYGLLVNKPKVIDAQYIYYRNRVFHRVGEPKNAGLEITPSDHTVLIVETTCEVGDPKWKGLDYIREAVANDLEAEGICYRDDIVEWHLLRSPYGYPIFHRGYETHFDRIFDHIGEFENLESVGRNGGFCFPNMHGAMRIGADTAERVADRLGSR